MKLKKAMVFWGIQAMGFSMCFTNSVFAAPVDMSSNAAFVRMASSDALRSEAINLEIGEMYMIPNSIIPDDVDMATVRYSSDNWDIARVNTRTGIVTAKTPGSCTITVTASGEAVATVDIVVLDKVPVTDIILSQDEIHMAKGERSSVTASVLPAEATQKGLRYSSSDPSVATVSQSTGLLKAVAGGSCTITVTSAGNPDIKKACNVTVTDIAIADIILDKSEMTVSIGEKAYLSAKVVPNDATTPKLSFASSNPDIATVNGIGGITGISAGECEISVTGGQIVKNCKVTVTPTISVDSVVMKSATLSMSVGGMDMVSAQILPENATNTKIRYTSSDPDIATVGGRNGVVKARKAGTCKIIATSDEGNKTAECEITVHAIIDNLEITNMEAVKNIDTRSSVQLGVKIYPSSSASEQLTYSSSNPEVAEVNMSGAITGKDMGETVITAQAANGVKVSVKVNVVYPEPIEIALPHFTMWQMVTSPSRVNLYDKILIIDKNGITTSSDKDRYKVFEYYKKDITFKTYIDPNRPVADLTDEGILTAINSGDQTIEVFYKGRWMGVGGVDVAY